MKKLLYVGLTVIVALALGLFWFKYYQKQQVEKLIYSMVKDATIRLESNLDGEGITYSEILKKIDKDTTQISQNIEKLTNTKNENLEIQQTINYLKLINQILKSDKYNKEREVYYKVDYEYFYKEKQDFDNKTSNLNLDLYDLKMLELRMIDDLKTVGESGKSWKKAYEIHLKYLSDLEVFLSKNISFKNKYKTFDVKTLSAHTDYLYNVYDKQFKDMYLGEKSKD